METKALHRIRLYKNVLGVHGDVNEEQLKRLYRNRAKKLHPDRNNDPRSHEQFVLLKEAYEFYSKLLSKNSEEKPSPFNSKKYPERYRKETWKAEERVKARKRAAERAKEKQRQFAAKGYYRRLEKFSLFVDVIRFFLALGLLFVLPIVIFNLDGNQGLAIVFFVQAITYPLWLRAIRKFIAITSGSK